MGSLGVRFVCTCRDRPGSNDLEAPMWLVYLAVPLGSCLMCFRFLQVACFLRTGELPHHDETQVEGVEKGEISPRRDEP